MDNGFYDLWLQVPLETDMWTMKLAEHLTSSECSRTLHEVWLQLPDWLINFLDCLPTTTWNI